MSLKSIFTAAYIIAVSAFIIYNTDQIKDDLINSNRKYVTRLTNMEQTHGGTGFYVQTPSGRVMTLTNGHVCRIAMNGALVSTTESDVEILYVDSQYEDNDLCLLNAPEGAKGLKVANSVRDLENIYVIGHPLLEPKTLVRGQMSGTQEIKVLQGYDMVCTGKTFKNERVDLLTSLTVGAAFACIRTSIGAIATAFILPGNSGSPVLNAYGNVVGVIFAGMPGTGRAFMVPLELVKDFLKDK